HFQDFAAKLLGFKILAFSGGEGVSVLDQPHAPAGGNGDRNQHDERVGAEADHHLGLRALGNAEHDPDAGGADQNGGEVGESHAGFLPMAMEWASIAATMLSSPTMLMNFVP